MSGPVLIRLILLATMFVFVLLFATSYYWLAYLSDVGERRRARRRMNYVDFVELKEKNGVQIGVLSKLKNLGKE
jgi:hypothetical protein